MKSNTTEFDIAMHRGVCSMCQISFETTFMERQLCDRCIRMQVKFMTEEPDFNLKEDIDGDDD